MATEYDMGSVIGPQGVAGTQGISVANVAVNPQGNLVVTLSSGAQIDAGNISGDKGDKGDVGKSAYQQAKEGGYTRTEAQFIVELNSISDKANADDVYTKDEVASQMGNKADIVEVLHDVDCHTLHKPKDYIIQNTSLTLAANVALHYPPEPGRWGLTIKSTLNTNGGNGKIYIATNRDSGNMWKKTEVSERWGEWIPIATATPPQELTLLNGWLGVDGLKSYHAKTGNNVVVNMLIKNPTEITQSLQIAYAQWGSRNLTCLVQTPSYTVWVWGTSIHTVGTIPANTYILINAAYTAG